MRNSKTKKAALLYEPVRQCSRDLCLPIEAQTKLNQPGIGVSISCDFSDSRRIQVRDRQIEVRMVHDVEEIRLEPEFLAFSHDKILLQGEIKVGIGRTVKRVPAGVPDIACARSCQVVRGKRLVNVTHVEDDGSGQDCAISKLVESAEICRSTREDGEGKASMPIGDTAYIPPADERVNEPVCISQESSSTSDWQFVEIKHGYLMAHVKGRRAIIGSGVSDISE